MPFYKTPKNELYWFDSEEEHASYIPAGSVQITDTEAEEIRAKNQADLLNALSYAEKRMIAYPSYADQFDLLYHGGYDAWKASIKAVKDSIPKE
jgi:hypothetical protein